MSAAVVHRPNTILPKFNFLLAGGAVVLSIIAITDNVGSNTATVAKPAAVTQPATVTHKAGAGTARPQHAAAAPARGLHQGEYFPQTPARGLHQGEYFPQTPNVRQLMNETVGFKIVAPAQSPGFGRRLMDDIGPVDNVQKVSAAAGVCGLKISTTC